MPYKPKKTKRPWESTSEVKAFRGRVNDNQKFYQSRQWRNARAIYIQQHPFCECGDCKKLPIPLPAQVVDHITPISRGGEPLDPQNFQSMSHKCHNKKSAKEAHQ